MSHWQPIHWVPMVGNGTAARPGVFTIVKVEPNGRVVVSTPAQLRAFAWKKYCRLGSRPVTAVDRAVVQPESLKAPLKSAAVEAETRNCVQFGLPPSAHCTVTDEMKAAWMSAPVVRGAAARVGVDATAV